MVIGPLEKGHAVREDSLSWDGGVAKAISRPLSLGNVHTGCAFIIPTSLSLNYHLCLPKKQIYLYEQIQS